MHTKQCVCIYVYMVIYGYMCVYIYIYIYIYPRVQVSSLLQGEGPLRLSFAHLIAFFGRILQPYASW